jgi:citrate synthase
MFTVLFALARTVGWISQWKEMFEDPQRKIGRPRQLYTGATSRKYVPLNARGYARQPSKIGPVSS